MKIAVIKLGGRIANEGHGITAFEAVSVSKMLSIGGNTVHCFTKMSEKDLPIPELTVLEISKYYDHVSGNYDALVVLNGNINFYGGAETPEQLMNLHIINNFDGGPVFYIFIDTLLPLKNVWGSIQGKPWSNKYKEKDMNITRDDIIYVTMSYDENSVREIAQKTGIIPNKIAYFPFEKYAFFSDRLNYVGKKSVDLIYGANSFRPKREKKLVKYYFGLPEDINVSFYGKMKLDDFKPANVAGFRYPTFEGPIQYRENLEKMNTAIATLNISDKVNEGTQLNPRVYETVLANVVSFMDIDYDPQKRAFTDPFLQDFLYVKNQKELVEKLRMLKSDADLMVKVIEAQYQNSYISKENLSKQFCNLINDLYLEEVKELPTINNIEVVEAKVLKPKALF